MTQAELNELERELGITLPAEYHELMLNFPISACRGNSDTELWDDAAALLRENKQLRQGMTGGVKPWPKHFYCLGGAGSGCVHALDLSRPEPSVWWVDHRHLDLETSQRLETSFISWATEYLSGLREDLTGEGVDPEGSPANRARVEAENAKHWLLPLLAVLALFLGVIYLVMRLLK